jgi:hypothetical protein
MVTCTKCVTSVPIEPKARAKFSQPWSNPENDRNVDLARLSEQA